MTKEKVLKFAEKFGFESVQKSEYQWRDYDEIWYPGFGREGVPCCYGPLRLILVKGDRIEMSTADEGKQFLDDLPKDDEDEEEDEDYSDEEDSGEE